MKSNQSSFKKFTKKADDRLYFGHKSLDAIFQNQLKKGQKFNKLRYYLGVILTMQEDSPSKLHIQLTRYFLGQGFHSNQKILIFDEKHNDWSTLIPSINTSKTKKNKQEQEQVIAWRYGEKTTEESIGQLDQNIFDFDLQKNQDVQNDLIQQQGIEQFQDLKQLFEAICDSYQKSLKYNKIIIYNNRDENDMEGKKILLCNIFNERNSREISKFLHSLKVFIKTSNCMCLISYGKEIGKQAQNLINQYSDIGFQIDELFGYSQYEDFQGIIQFKKLPQYHNLSVNRLDQMSFGIKASSKRKMEIERLYLSPEDHQPQDSICGSKPNSNQYNY